jgi:hypothetical protein
MIRPDLGREALGSAREPTARLSDGAEAVARLPHMSGRVVTRAAFAA